MTDGQLAPAEFHQQTVIGPLAIKATGAYDVNWGDGTTSGPYATEGLPYPSGTITHSYDNVGTYTVTVTELWSASWSLGAAGGVLNQLHTKGVIDNFPVRQVQAVITG